MPRSPDLTIYVLTIDDKGKAINLSIVVVVGMKITRSRVLGICERCKHNQSVDIGGKLVSTQFELLKMAS